MPLSSFLRSFSRTEKNHGPIVPNRQLTTCNLSRYRPHNYFRRNRRHVRFEYTNPLCCWVERRKGGLLPPLLSWDLGALQVNWKRARGCGGTNKGTEALLSVIYHFFFSLKLHHWFGSRSVWPLTWGIFPTGKVCRRNRISQISR